MKYHLIVTMLFFTFFSTSQNLADTISISKNALSVEFLGTSCNILSVHYDRIIKKNKTSYYSTDIGIGYMPYLSNYKSNAVTGASIAIDWNNNLYKKNHLVGGIGLAYSEGLFQLGFPDDIKLSHKVLYGSLRLGYKFQKTTKSVFYKILVSPLFKIHEFTKLYKSAPSALAFAGIGAGYSF